MFGWPALFPYSAFNMRPASVDVSKAFQALAIVACAGQPSCSVLFCSLVRRLRIGTGVATQRREGNAAAEVLRERPAGFASGATNRFGQRCRSGPLEARGGVQINNRAHQRALARAAASLPATEVSCETRFKKKNSPLEGLPAAGGPPRHVAPPRRRGRAAARHHGHRTAGDRPARGLDVRSDRRRTLDGAARPGPRDRAARARNETRRRTRRSSSRARSGARAWTRVGPRTRAATCASFDASRGRRPRALNRTAPALS